MTKKQFKANSGDRDYSRDAAESTKSTSNAGTDTPTTTTPLLECPPGKTELGRSTWTFLHTMAAYYPSKPSKTQQTDMLGLIKGLSQFYPCEECAHHLRDEILENPPKVKDNIELSDWFCQIHNQVNIMQGKPTFDCSKVFERWKTGSSKCFRDEE